MTDKQDLPPLPTLPFAVFDEFGASCEDRVRDHFHAAIRSHEAERGAKGWKLVPVELTDSMVDAVASPGDGYIGKSVFAVWAENWASLLAAAPTPEASRPACPDQTACEHGAWCTETYCQKLAAFRKASNPVQAEAPRCSYPQCTGEQPADGSCCKQPFTSAMADAAERYWRAVGPNAHPLPAQFRWVDCFRAMEAAAPSPKASNPVQAEAPTASNAERGDTDDGRNMFFEGRFDGESEREQRARLRWADDMRAAFERHTGNGWFDKDWRAETGIWIAAWRAALATQPQAAYIAELERRIGECEGALETQTKVYDGKPQPEQVAQDGDLLALLEEVSRHYTREDDLPDNLLPRIDAAIDAARTRGEGA